MAKKTQKRKYTRYEIWMISDTGHRITNRHWFDNKGGAYKHLSNAKLAVMYIRSKYSKYIVYIKKVSVTEETLLY